MDTMLLKAVEVWDTLLSQILSEDSTPLTTARECILTFLLGSSMDFPWAPFVMPLLVEQTIKHLLILRQALLFLAVARGKWGHTLRLPRVGGAPGVGHIQGQLLPSGTPVLLLVLLVEGRPQGHTWGWAGDGRPLLQAGWRPAGSLVFCPDSWSSCSCTFYLPLATTRKSRV